MPSSADLLLELRSLRETGRLLYVAAHPDDENTRLITYFARARGFAAGYLSLTRGDGGQNLIGPELSEGLGAIRTQELLAARALDGGQQFFARAVDFGFCKDYREALRIWHRDEVLADTVRVIRTFRPDVIVTRFPPEPGGTHGHHTASTILALEAFEAAGDPSKFPEQLDVLEPWRAVRIFWNIFQPPMPGAKRVPIPEGSLELDVGAWLPLMGHSVGEIASRSRSMHRSQGMGAVGTRGVTLEHFKQLGGEPARETLFDGIDTSWRRFPGGEEITAAVDALLLGFDAAAPERSVPALLALRPRLAALPAGRVRQEKTAQLDRVLAGCLGLYVETRVPSADVVPGETMDLTHVAIARAGFPVRWLGVRDGGALGLDGAPIALEPNVPAIRVRARPLPAKTPMTQPFWLAEPGTPGMFTVSDPHEIGLPETGPAYALTHAFEVGGQTLEIADGPMHVYADQVKGELRVGLRAIPPVSLEFARPLELFAPGATRTVELELIAARPDLSGPVRLDAPPGWTVSPTVQAATLGAPGERVRVAFAVTAPPAPVVARITACVTIGGVEYKRRRQDIRYDHIPPQVLQPAASLRAVCLDLAIRGRRIGYLPGAGDGVDVALERMGWEVVRLSDADLTVEGLRGLDAVVLGIRAFNIRPGLPPRLTALYQWIADGGTVVGQYNTNHALVTPRVAPVPLSLSRERVTDEASAVELLDPAHPALTGPNPIGPDDFTGWVQERGLYFADSWDPAFAPLLSMGDPGEAPKRGALMVARHGRGWFVYTGLSFFRQLQAGVPGAYRLFANLVSLRGGS